MARFGAGGPSAGFGSRSTGSSSRGSSSRGSSLGDGGGRAANNGGMSASTGSSARSTSNQASPSRSTPGSPNAADGRRGASMGASGGSARDASNATTNPGRPGGESGERSFTPSGGESIRGSSNARSSFSYDSESVRNQLAKTGDSFRRAREQQVALEGNDAPMEGLIAPSVEGLENNNSFINNALYGDDTINALADTVRENNNPAIQVGMSPIPGPLSMVKNAAQGVANSFAANNASDTAKDLSVMSGIPLGANTRDLSAGYNAESMSEGLIGGFLGNEQGVRDAVGVQPRALRNPVAMAIPGMDPYGDINVNQQTVDNLAGVSWSPNRENTGGGGGVEEQAPPPEQQPLPPQQRPNSERGPFAGRMTNYGSYRRRFFSRV